MIGGEVPSPTNHEQTGKRINHEGPAQRLEGVDDAPSVDVIGLENNKNVALRQRLRQKNIHLLVVKNSLARRATEGTRLARAFDNAQGTMALIWGGEDIISLAKEVVKIAGDKQFEKFIPKGGVMDGQPWPPLRSRRLANGPADWSS